jgi:hypothetical protein
LAEREGLAGSFIRSARISEKSSGHGGRDTRWTTFRRSELANAGMATIVATRNMSVASAGTMVSLTDVQ